MIVFDDILVLFTGGIFTWIGFIILNQLKVCSKLHFLEKISFSYGLGVGIVAIQMFLYSWVGMTWSVVSILLPWLFVSLFLLITKRISVYTPKKFRFSKSRLINFFIILIAINCLYVLFEAWLRPVSGFDAFANWLMGAKAIFLQGQFSTQVFSYLGYDLPFLVQSMVAFFYIIAGHVNDRSVLLLFSFFYICSLGLFYSFLRRNVSSKKALFFTFLLATIQNLIRQAGRYDVGYADLLQMYYFFSTYVLLSLSGKSKLSSGLFLFSIFLGIGALVKNEGSSFFIILNSIGLIIFYREKALKKALYLLPGLFIFVIWQVFKVTFHVPPTYLTRGSLIISRVPDIMYYTLKELFNIGRWNLVWFSFIFSLFVGRYNFTRTLAIIIAALQLCVYLFVYALSPVPPSAQIPNSFDRLLIHILPFAMISIAAAFFPSKGIKAKEFDS